MTDKMTPERLDSIGQKVRDGRPVARSCVRAMAAEIRRCWGEIEKMGKMIDWLNKMISARGCAPPVLRPPERIPCPGGMSCEACWREAAERAVSE